jgi:hypothetical protein
MRSSKSPNLVMGFGKLYKGKFDVNVVRTID